MPYERFDPEQAKAHAIVEFASKPPAPKADRNYRRGQKLLPGATTVAQDALIRHVVASQFCDKTDVDISRELGKYDNYITKLQIRKREAFDEARKQHIDGVIERHAKRMVQVRGYLTEAALEAVACLRHILSDNEAAASVKRRAACDILNLFYSGATKGEGGRDGVSRQVGVLIQNITPQAEKTVETYIETIDMEEDDDV